jgi:hypothetical protein
MTIIHLKVMNVLSAVVRDLQKRELHLELFLQTAGGASVTKHDVCLGLYTESGDFGMLMNSAMTFNGKDFLPAPGISLMPVNHTAWHSPSVKPNSKSIPMRESETVEMSYLYAWWFRRSLGKSNFAELDAVYPEIAVVSRLNLKDICSDLEPYILWTHQLKYVQP